jgi:acetyl esterase
MLDKQLEALMNQARAAGAPDLCDLPVPAARGLYRQILSASGSPADELAVRDLRMPGVAPGTTIGLRIYAPRDARALPVVVWYHGGGYVLGDLDGYDGVCRQLCVDAGAVVVAVDYRLAPEHPFPAAFDDAWAALRWVASPAGAEALGAAADTQRLAVAGDSAGAVLSSAMCLLARDAGGPHIRFQALAYPPAAGSHAGDFPSRLAHAGGPTLTARTIAFFDQHFFGESGRAPDFRAAPLSAPSLAGLPPALVQLAAFDPLRDEGFAFAQRLLAEGNAVTLVEYHGLAHGYLSQGAVVRSARWAQRQFGEALRDALHAAP